MDAALEARLCDLIRQEGRSLLQYVSEAFPWTTAHDQAVKTAVLRFAHDEADALAKLSRHLAKERVRLPYTGGGFPMSYTTVNFVSLGYLLPRLAAEQETHVAAVERLWNALPDGPTRDHVAQLLVKKKQHLAELRTFAAQIGGQGSAA